MNTEETRSKIVEIEKEFLPLADQIPEIIWITDEEACITHVSPSVTSVLGYTPEEAVGRQFMEFLTPDSVQIIYKFHEQFINVIQNGQKYSGGSTIPIGMYSRDGTTIRMEILIDLIYGSSRKFGGIVCVTRDVRKRIQEEEALLESEQKFRSFVENANEVLYSLSPDGRFTYLSPKITELLGYDVDEVNGKNASIILHPDDFDKNRDFFILALSTGKNLTGNEYRIRHKDGSWKWHSQSITPIYNEEGDLIRIDGISHDITRLKNTEEALRQSEEKFRSFVENANDIVFSLAPDGMTTYVSPRWTALLGHDTSEIIGKPVRHIHPEDLPRFREFFNNALKTGKKASGIEYRIHHKDGSWQWHTQSISPICDSEGNVISVEGICHDITERKKTEEALRQANSQLNLLSSITRHDILNKISVIRGNLALIEMDSKDPEILGYLQVMKSATGDVQEQIEFTRIYQDLGSHEPQWIDLKAAIPSSHLPVPIKLEEDLNGIFVFSDPMLEKVFFNLLDNSVKHGHQVTHILVSAVESDNNLVVVWEDDGDGIPDDEKDLIFERGFGKNTGLGMFLIREILSLTGMTICETGVPGSGARFEIMVPKGGWRKPDR